MGPIAGPCVVACVVLTDVVPGVKDSKKLERTTLYRIADAIREKAKFIHVAHRLHDAIDRMGLSVAWAQCQQECFRAVRAKFPGIEVQADWAPNVLSKKTQQYIGGINFIKGGDDDCYEVGAASIVAKSWQLMWMADAHKQYPKYGFNEHAGYGTQDHLAALKDFGPCGIHRISAVSKIQKKNRAPIVEELNLTSDQVSVLLTEAKPFLEKEWVGEWEKNFLGSILRGTAAGARLTARQQFYLKRTVGRLKHQERKR